MFRWIYASGKWTYNRLYVHVADSRLSLSESAIMRESTSIPGDIGVYRYQSKLVAETPTLSGPYRFGTSTPSQFSERRANYDCYSVLKACDGLVEAAR